MKNITTVKDLKEALGNYPDDFLVIGIYAGINENAIKSIALKQAQGSQGTETFDMPLVHIFLDKNVTIGRNHEDSTLLLQPLEH